MNVRQEQPPPTRTLSDELWPERGELVEKALANRDEWFAIDIPEAVSPNRVTGLVRNAILSRLPMEIKQKADTVYLRIGAL